MCASGCGNTQTKKSKPSNGSNKAPPVKNILPWKNLARKSATSSAGKETENNSAYGQRASKSVCRDTISERWKKIIPVQNVRSAAFFPIRYGCVREYRHPLYVDCAHTNEWNGFRFSPPRACTQRPFARRLTAGCYTYTVPIDLASCRAVCVCVWVCACVCVCVLACTKAVVLVLDYNWPLIATANVGGREITLYYYVKFVVTLM